MRFILLALLLTTAHAQWDIQNSGTTADLRGIDSVGAGIAWASGSNGTVLRTEDGGYLWQRCTVPPGAEKLDFRGIQAFDANTAIVMSSGLGDLSRLYKTTDGCQTWKLVFMNPDKDGFFDGMSFLFIKQATNHQLSVDHADGTLLGDPVNGEFSIFQTHDGGESWTRRIARKWDKQNNCQIDTFAAIQGESAFAASNESLVFPYPYLFFFVTGGTKSRVAYVDHFDLDFSFCHESAKYIDLSLKSGAASSGAFAIAMKPIDGSGLLDLMVVGGNYQLPNATEGASLFLSPKGAVHSLFPSHMTITTPTTPVHGYRSAVAYDASTKTWITVGPNGTDISTDDGRNWRALKPRSTDAPDADSHWNALSLPFVVGPHGRIGLLNPAALSANGAALYQPRCEVSIGCPSDLDL